MPPEELDWILVPGLAFDTSGGRLGFGRGYYDALLERAPRALRVGAGFAWQVVAQVPLAPHDQKLDFILADRAHATGARPLPLPKEQAR
jgi:5-formyltetrahydrofolate cyclo-ligase